MQVISNLLANSIYAMPDGGTLSIAVHDATEPCEGIALTVQDTGTGILQDVLPKVFDAFFTTRATVGTGIGLFVAQIDPGIETWVSNGAAKASAPLSKHAHA